MSRPSRMMPQQQIEEIADAMATPLAGRWRWLFTPDPRWLNVVNTTNLRTVNATRMFVGVTLLFIVMELAVTCYALTRCGILLKVGSFTIFQLLPPPGKLTVEAWRLCEESLATDRMLNFVSNLFGTYSWLLAGMASIALGAMGIKRATDTEHRVAVEHAKKAPVIMPVTQDHPAQPMQAAQTIINNAAPVDPVPDPVIIPDDDLVPGDQAGGKALE